MKTGDIVRDVKGRTYQLGQLLGRGLWGKSYLVRRESDDTHHVLKCALGPGDFRGDVPDALYNVCREALLEQARAYEQGQAGFLPRLEERVTLPDGAPAYIIPRYSVSLERRFAEGLPVAALIDALLGVIRVARQLGPITGGPSAHGALRPSNILFNERGDVILTDVATPAVRRAVARLSAAAGGQPYLPPELLDTSTEGVSTPSVDTYALGMMLWRCVGASEDGPPAYPRGGLDKAAQVALKDRLLERMKLEDSNPRFHARLAERVAVLLSRALSRETSPSPPYRFPRSEEFATRLEEAQALIRPTVTSLGKVLLDRPAAKPWFQTDEEVAFSCTVGCTPGVEGQEEIGVGIALFELDRDQRIKDLDLGYNVDKHPSGRYRFAFRIGALPPGRYKARIAFAVRDSGQPPSTAESEFNVRAAPGWVPRNDAPVAGALPLRAEPLPEPGAPNLFADFAPTPVAPLPPEAVPASRGEVVHLDDRLRGGTTDSSSVLRRTERREPEARPAHVPQQPPRAEEPSPSGHAFRPAPSAAPAAPTFPPEPAPLPYAAAAEPARRTGLRDLEDPPSGPISPLTPGPQPPLPGMRSPEPRTTRPFDPRAVDLSREAQPPRASPVEVEDVPSWPGKPSPTLVAPAPLPAATRNDPPDILGRPVGGGTVGPRPIAPAAAAEPEPLPYAPPEAVRGASEPMARPPAGGGERLTRPLGSEPGSVGGQRPVEPGTTPPAPVRAAPPEPTYEARNWTNEPLPGARGVRARDLESEEPSGIEPADADHEPDDDAGPGFLDRVVEQLRGDPYIAVTAALSLMIVALLFVFLLLRSGS